MAGRWSPRDLACKLRLVIDFCIWALLVRATLDDEGLGMAVRSLPHSAPAPPSSADDGVPVGQAMAQQASQPLPQQMPFDGYCVERFHDEMFFPAGGPRPCCQPLFERVQRLSSEDLQRRQLAAEGAMLRLGITFSV